MEKKCIAVQILWKKNGGGGKLPPSPENWVNKHNWNNNNSSNLIIRLRKNSMKMKEKKKTTRNTKKYITQ